MSVKENVASILENNVFARDDDNTLIFLYWMRFDGLTPDRLKVIADMGEKVSNYVDLSPSLGTSTDSIKQARRELQREGYFRASDLAVHRRMSKQIERLS